MRWNVQWAFRLLLVVGIIGIFYFSSVDNATGITITVDGDGGGDYAQIQDAIDNATAGDTILISKGDYHENIVIEKSLILRSDTGSNTNIVGDRDSPTISILADSVSVRGLTLSNGTYSHPYGNIFINSNNSEILENEFIGEIGSHIYTLDCHENIIENNSFSNALIYAVNLFNSNDSSIIGNTFDMEEGRGIGLRLSNNNSIIENELTNTLVGIQCSQSNGTLIEGNILIEYWTAIHLTRSSVIDIKNNTMRNGLVGIGLDQFVRDAEISGNKISLNEHFGIMVFGGTNNLTIVGNRIQQNYNGVFIDHTDIITFSSNFISNNTIGMNCSQDNNQTSIIDNNIFSNYAYGILNEDESNFINAINNWWGYPSGPYHDQKNSQGKGDNISDFVLVDPWLVLPFDYVQPIPIIDSIFPNPAIYGENITFSGNASGAIEVIRYVWKIDDVEFYNGTDSIISYSVPLPGQYEISFKIMDKYGFWSTDRILILNVHDYPPEITLLHPLNGSTNVTKDDFFRWSGTDREGDNLTYLTWVGWQPANMPTIGESIKDEFYPIDDGNLIFKYDHTYYWQVNVCDENDCTRSEVWSFTTIKRPENQRPTLMISGPMNNTVVSGKIEISGSASDDDGTVSNVEITITDIDRVGISMDNITAWNHTWDSTEFRDGEYRIKIRCFDGTDWSEEKTITLIVENEEDSGGGFIPGFDLITFISSMGIIGVVDRKRNISL